MNSCVCGAYVPSNWRRHANGVAEGQVKEMSLSLLSTTLKFGGRITPIPNGQTYEKNCVDRLKQAGLSTTSRGNTRGGRGVRGCMNVGA
jgi:hypothetical protein